MLSGCGCGTGAPQASWSELAHLAEHVVATSPASAAGVAARQAYVKELRRTALSGLGSLGTAPTTAQRQTVAASVSASMRQSAQSTGINFSANDLRMAGIVVDALNSVVSVVLGASGAPPEVSRWIRAVFSWVSFAIKGTGNIELPPTGDADMRAFADFCRGVTQYAETAGNFLDGIILGAQAAASAANNAGLLQVLTMARRIVPWLRGALRAVCTNPELQVYISMATPASTSTPTTMPPLTLPSQNILVPYTPPPSSSSGSAALIVPAALVAAWFLLR